MSSGKKQLYNIAMITDYFYPNTGGIESHVRTIGEELCKLGHKIIIITHSYKGYKGCKQIGSLIVYYLDIPIIACNTTIPTIFCCYVLYKEIFLKHDINIVHGHQTMSSMCMEGIYHANHLNIKTVLTDHSVFEFSKFERIMCDSLSYFVCRNVDRAICVSNIAKINTHVRTGMLLHHINVIPNGIVPEYFYPKTKVNKAKIRLIFCARLVFRKGIDLLIETLPIICKDKRFEVYIVGDGPKRDDIVQKIDENELHDQVKILGEKKYHEIADLIRTGDIFLNTSLTETFCMAILEAASCGLLTVSTNVGGIHEVLDEGIVYFCKPTPEDIAEQVFNAAANLENHDPGKYYKKILEKYDWSIITKQTVKVYDEIPDKQDTIHNMINRFVGPGCFLYRFGTWLEFFQIKILAYFQ